MADVRIKYRVDKGELVLARNELDKINNELGVTKEKGNSAANSLKLVGGVIAAAFTIDKLVSFGREVISITAEFQKLKAVLINTLGSRSAADQAFKNIQQFAANTPFQVNQIMESFVRLANRGITPGNDQLTKMGDLASALGKDIGQLTEALLDVSNTERWTELGIKVSSNGDRMTGTFKGLSVEVDRTEKGALEMVEAFGSMAGVSGSMAAISETLGGKLSNLQDGIDSLFYEIGTKLNPVIGGAIDVMGSLIGTMTDFIGTPFVQQLRIQQGELNVLVGAITDVNVSEQARSHLITELNSKYPDFLKNLDIEKVTNEQLKSRMSDVNDQFLRKIALTAAEGRLADQQEELLDNIEREADLRKSLAAQRERDEQIRAGNVRRQRSDAGLVNKLEQQLNEVVASREAIQQGLTDQLKTYTSALNLFNSENNDYFEGTEEGNKATERATTLTKAQIKALEDLEKQRQKNIDTERDFYERDFEAAIQLSILRQEDAEKQEIARRNLTLNSQQLTENERQLIIAESEENIRMIREQAAQDFQASEEQRLALTEAVNQARFDSERTLAQQTGVLLSELGRDYQAAAFLALALEKGLAISDLLIRLQQEIAAINALAAANPANAVTFGAAGIAQAAALTAAAKIRTGIGIGLIAATGIVQASRFAEGEINLKGGVKGKDSIPALLMPGESVMTTQETRDFMPTLKAIRENRISPDILNSLADGKLGRTQVHNVVTEVPRDTMVWDENGFSWYMQKKDQIIKRKNVRYKC